MGIILPEMGADGAQGSFRHEAAGNIRL
ncbi:MAG: hypothetical protein V3T44_07995 [bacterium]